MRLVLVQPRLRHAPDADHLAVIRRVLEGAGEAFTADDLVLLPEGCHPSDDAARYVRDVGALARGLGCHVFGGSHQEHVNGASVNAGVAVDPGGAVICRYEKLRPYADEGLRVRPGTALGALDVAGRRILVVVCADFWYADIIQRLRPPPDLVLVAALSVTRKPTAKYARTLWQHLAVARAYEFGTYVGISDWAADSGLPAARAAGVGGFADPTTAAAERLFTPMGEARMAVHPLDFAALAALRRERAARGFLSMGSAPDRNREAAVSLPWRA
jgi:omega-amidase